MYLRASSLSRSWFFSTLINLGLLVRVKFDLVKVVRSKLRLNGVATFAVLLHCCRLNIV